MLGTISDDKANDTVTVTPTYTQVGCNQNVSDVIRLTVTADDGQTASAPPVTITIDRQCIQ